MISYNYFSNLPSPVIQYITIIHVWLNLKHEFIKNIITSFIVHISS